MLKLFNQLGIQELLAIPFLGACHHIDRELITRCITVRRMTHFVTMHSSRHWQVYTSVLAILHMQTSPGLHFGFHQCCNTLPVPEEVTHTSAARGNLHGGIVILTHSSIITLHNSI